MDESALAPAPAPTPREILYGGEQYDGGGEVSDGIARFADMGYYRNKIREFQQHLNSLAAIGVQMEQLATSSDDETAQAAMAWLDDLEANRSALLLTAEAVNAAAETINAVGGRMPVVSIPQRLAALPAFAIAAVAGAVAGTAWAVAYAIDKGTEAANIASRYAMIEGLPPEQRAAALSAEQNIERARAAAESPIGTVANVIKWAALAVAVWYGYRAVRDVFPRKG